jgi:hypothetical protein
MSFFDVCGRTLCQRRAFPSRPSVAQFNPAFLLSSAAFHVHLGGLILPETGVKNAVFVDYYS